MQGINCVKGEIHNVLTVLRLTSSPDSHLSHDDTTLIRNLKELYETIGDANNLQYINTDAYLEPFLQVIASHETDVQATGIALHSVHKFLVYGHVHEHSPRAEEAVSNIAYYVTNCRFDARNVDDSEVVFMKILEVVLECLRCSAGHLLSDESVCGMIQECCNVRNRTGASKQIRKYAENVLMQMVLVIFARLNPDTTAGGKEIVIPKLSHQISGGYLTGHRGSHHGIGVPISNSSSQSSISTVGHASPSSSLAAASAHANSGHHHHHHHHHASSPSHPVSSRPAGNFTKVISRPSAYNASKSKPTERKAHGTSSGSSVVPSAAASPSPSAGVSVTVSTASPAPVPSTLNDIGQATGPGQARKNSAVAKEYKTGPYGIPALQRVLKFLAGLIQPADPTNDIYTRVLGLRLIRTVFETAGPRIGAFPALVRVIQDDLCKYLLQNSQSKELFILSLTLRIVYDMFLSVKKHLKVQLEVFFTSIHLRIGENPSSTFEQKRLVMESLVEFCKEKALIAGIYRNYDCEVGSTNLFEDLCKFLAQGSFITNPVSNDTTESATLNVLSLEGIVGVLVSIRKRFCIGHNHGQNDLFYYNNHHLTRLYSSQHTQFSSASSFNEVPSLLTPTSASGFMRGLRPGSVYPLSIASRSHSEFDLKDVADSDAEADPISAEEAGKIHRSRQTKQTLKLAAERFNKEAHKSFPYLQSIKVLADPLTPESVTKFFKTTPNLDKVHIGQFLGNEKAFNVSVLDHFSSTFDFKHNVPSTRNLDTSSYAPAPSSPRKSSEPPAPVAMDDALRYYLDFFRLPGEAQQISRVLEHFSRYFYRAQTSLLANEDAAYVLAYSIVMLNTDAHNPMVQKKMQLEEFIRMVRGINDKKDLPRDYLTDIYMSITTNEIRLSSEDKLGDKENGFSDTAISNKQWRNMLTRSRTTGEFRVSAPVVHGREMFSLMWESTLNIFLTFFEKPAYFTPAFKEHYLTTSVEDEFPTISINSKQDKLLCKVVKGIDTFACICTTFGLYDIFNHLIIAMSKILLNFFEEIADAQSERGHLIAFGRHRRATILASLLFSLVRRYGKAHVREGWTNILQVVLWLHHLDMLPSSLLDMEDFTDSSGQPLDSLRKIGGLDSSSSDVAADVGIGTLFTSALSFMWTADPDEGEDDGMADPARDYVRTEYEHLARECLDGLHVHDIFRQTHLFTPTSLSYLVRSLVLVSTYGITPSIVLEVMPGRILNEESAVFCLERLCDIVELNQFRLFDSELNLWNTIHHHFDTAISKTSKGHSQPSFYIERVVVNLLRFSARLKKSGRPASNAHAHQHAPTSSQPEGNSNSSHADAGATEGVQETEGGGRSLSGETMRHIDAASTVTHLIQVQALLLNLSQPCLKLFGQRITAGMLMFIKLYADQIATQDIVHWSPIFRLLVKFKYHNTAARSAFSSLMYLINHHVSVDSFAPILAVLHAFLKPTTDVDVWLPVRPKEILTAMLQLHSTLNNPQNLIPRTALPLPSSRSELVITTTLDTADNEDREGIVREPGDGASMEGRNAHQGDARAGNGRAGGDDTESTNGAAAATNAHGKETKDVHSSNNKDGAHLHNDHSHNANGHGNGNGNGNSNSNSNSSSSSSSSKKDGTHSTTSLSQNNQQQVINSHSKYSSPEALERARCDLWLHSLQVLCGLCLDRRSQVRVEAFESLQQALLGCGIAMRSGLAWKVCFEKLLIPLLDAVSKFPPQRVTVAHSSGAAANNKGLSSSIMSGSVASHSHSHGRMKNVGSNSSLSAAGTGLAGSSITGSAPGGTVYKEIVFDIRLRSANLLFQTFLHNLDQLARLNDFHIFWLKFVGSMERYMKTNPDTKDNKKGALSIHFTESLKNVLLVMHASGTFEMASKRSGQDLWALTWTVIDSFRPELRHQLIASINPKANQNDKKTDASDGSGGHISDSTQSTGASGAGVISGNSDVNSSSGGTATKNNDGLDATTAAAANHNAGITSNLADTSADDAAN